MTTTWTNSLLWLRSTGTAVPAGNRFAIRSPWNRERTCEVAYDEGRSHQALQVMVVADTSDTADGLAAAVRKWGHDAHAFRTGHIADTTLQPDVVLLDIESMPFGERLMVQRRCRELAWPNCLIVAFIRHAGPEHRRQYRTAGVDLVLVKPVELVVMETLLLLECTRKNRLRREAGRSSWL
jgi:CheY-like chemotaxis protein